MKAFAVNRIQRRDSKGNPEVIKAGAVFDVTSDDFKKLEALGAARKATTDEVAIAKANAERTGEAFVDSDDTATTLIKQDQAGNTTSIPSKSNATNDASAAPKGAKTASKSSDLDV